MPNPINDWSDVTAKLERMSLLGFPRPAAFARAAKCVARLDAGGVTPPDLVYADTAGRVVFGWRANALTGVRLEIATDRATIVSEAGNVALKRALVAALAG